MQIESYFIDSFEAFKSLQSVVEEEGAEFVSLDLETNSAQEKIAQIWGIGLSFSSHEGFYVPIRDREKNLFWTEEQIKTIYKWVTYLCENKRLIGHNLVYDCLVWENNTGHRISDYVYSDSILLKHLINEERPHGLKEAAVKYLGPGADLAQEELYANIEANGGSTTKENTEMWKADSEILGRYCVWDTVLSRKLHDLFLPQLIEQGLEKFYFEDEVMPLFHVTCEMKRYGFPVDVPYFQKLHEDISREIDFLEEQVQLEIKDEVEHYIRQLLEEEFPCKRTGNFPKMLAKLQDLPLPEKNGKVTLAKKEIKKIADHRGFYKWLLGSEVYSPPKELIRKVQEALFKKKYPDQKYIFNLGSNKDLGWLFFDRLSCKPLSKTEGGKPQCDDDFLESVKDGHGFVHNLVEYKKLQKLDSTYILGILERQIDGVLYSSMLQFGTTSGRYSSTNPNCQNLPRTKGEDADLSPMVLKYGNAIRKGFVAPPGYKLVDQDYQALEPRCFADMSEDANLRQIFFSGEDMYSAIAKRVFRYGPEVSTYKKDKNFLGNIYPEKRQIIKAMALAVTYGAEGSRIADLLDISKNEAEQIIEDYLTAFPGLKGYMSTCDSEAATLGYVKTRFGRIRHLGAVKGIYSRHGDRIKDWKWANKMGLKDIRRAYKNGLNNAKNYKIQGLAAHIVNRAMIAIHNEFKARAIDGRVALMIHDQIIAIVREDQVEQARAIMKNMAENTTKISVPLIADPKIGRNLSESH